MPLFDKDGKEIPGAMTQEEVTAKIEEAKTAAKTDADKIVATLNQQLADAKANEEKARLAVEEAAKGGGSGDNAALRKILEDTQKQVTELTTKVADAPKIAQQMISSNTRDGVIKKLSGNDANLEAKIKINYDKLIKLEAEITDEVITKVAADAYKLSVDVPNTNVLNSVMSSKPKGGPANQNDGNQVPSEIGQWLPSFGISEEDFKKFGKKK